MLSQRQKSILEVIIREFVESGEPVASAAITKKYTMDCCSATIRNEMSHLEELGYLEQPHTSAGRVPKDKAYRLFVDDLIKGKIALPPIKTVETIQREYQLIQIQMEILLKKTARLLSEITNYTSLLLAPRLRKSLFKYLKLISLSPRMVLLFVVTNTGSIINSTIEVSRPMNAEDLERITNLLNDRLQGKHIGRIEHLLNGILVDDMNSELIEGVKDISQNLARDYAKEVFFGGRTHLLDFFDTKDISRIKLLMDLLEDENIVAEILGSTLTEDGLQVMIGEENVLDEMSECSMVTATYKFSGEPIGTLGIIGPKRMPYDKVISIVNYTAENFSNKLQNFDML